MDTEKFLQTQAIRHPFRQSLYPNVVQVAREDHRLDAVAPSKRKWLGEDASLFLLSFLSFFTAFYTFIA
ncbi:hypothetical protein [Parasphingorhabdus flavimaris]|jgi:hypothetical protein|uniref:hypothetical protein n=1 Tax=Parasphingorhabdus flavimaris TaxID=266812 RepID=UPI003001D960